MSGTNSERVIVDGTNVVRHTGEPRLENLDLILEELSREGVAPVVYFDANTRYDFTGLGELDAKLEARLTALSKKAQKVNPVLEERAGVVREKTRSVSGADPDAEVLPGDRAILWVSEENMGQVIGSGGENIRELEGKTNVRIDVEDERGRPKGGFGPGTRVFEEVDELIRAGTGRELGPSAELLRVKRDKDGEWCVWKVVDGDQTYEIRRWDDGGEGGERFVLHDLNGEELERYEDLLSSNRFIEVPKGVDADSWVLNRAERENSLVLTNDGYENYEDRYPFFRDSNRFLGFRIGEGGATVEELSEKISNHVEVEGTLERRVEGFDLVEGAGDEVISLINRAEEELTVYSPYILIL